MKSFKRSFEVLGLVWMLTACGGNNNGTPADIVGGVESDPLRAGYGLLSAIPTLTLKMDGAYSPLAYASSSPIELVECVSDSPNVVIGCSVENAILHVSAVARSGADATQLHVQVKNATRTFHEVTIPVVVKGSCDEIKAAGLAQENSVYIVHLDGNPAGLNSEVTCTF